MADRMASVLLEGSNIYGMRLVDVIINDMLDTFRRMRRGSRNLVTFQMKLRQVPKWNKDVIAEHTNKILVHCPQLKTLLTAVFLARVQVLSYVRLPNSRTDIKVQVPGNNTFVHAAYSQAANDLYDTIVVSKQDCMVPELMPQQKQIIACSIEKAVKQLVPYDVLMDAYIADDVDNHGMISPEPFSGTSLAIPPEPDLPADPDSDHEREAVAHEPSPLMHTEPEPEAEPELEPEPEAEAEAEHVQPEDQNWMDDGRSADGNDMPAKRIELSPRSRHVMCEDATGSGEIGD